MLRLLLLFCATILLSCATPSRRYPAHWFTPVSSEGAPAWEILPQAAAPGEVILSKRNELGILSNFAPTPFSYRGKRYASLEGFWQMMHYPEDANDPRSRNCRKPCVWTHSREEVAAMVAFDAKRAGDEAERLLKTLRIDWVSFEGKRMPYRSDEGTRGEHYRLIREAMQAKFDQNPEVQRVLLSTGDLRLKPDHHQSPSDPPEWRYYEIWMEIRDKARQASDGR